jgi:hypothetical protein
MTGAAAVQRNNGGWGRRAYLCPPATVRGAAALACGALKDCGLASCGRGGAREAPHLGCGQVRSWCSRQGAAAAAARVGLYKK